LTINLLITKPVKSFGNLHIKPQVDCRIRDYIIQNIYSHEIQTIGFLLL